MRRVILFVLSLPLAAQWLKYPTPGIPRNADGKPNLTAPAPKTADGTPDLSGIWHIDGLGNIAVDLKADELLPWAQAVYQQRVDNFVGDAPISKCLPAGPAIGLYGELQKVIQTPGLVAILNEWGIFRQVFTDGRKLPEDPTPAWQGYSIGHWEGDTLVVETAGFNDKSWLDASGHPHTESLRITERYRRKDFGHMTLQMTYEDPKTFTKAFTIAMDVNLVPDTELLEFVCNENERDSQHLVGKLSDQPKDDVKVAPAVLAKYEGTYRIATPRMEVGIAVSERGALTMSINGRGAVELIARSEHSFYDPGVGGVVEFYTDAQGHVTHLILAIAEGDFKAERK